MISSFIAQRAGFDLLVFRPQQLDAVFGFCTISWLCLFLITSLTWIGSNRSGTFIRLRWLSVACVAHISCSILLAASAVVGVHCYTVSSTTPADWTVVYEKLLNWICELVVIWALSVLALAGIYSWRLYRDSPTGR